MPVRTWFLPRNAFEIYGTTYQSSINYRKKKHNYFLECIYKKWQIYASKQFDRRLGYNCINNSMVFVLIYMRYVSEDKGFSK